jgi:methylglyoxal reductase
MAWAAPRRSSARRSSRRRDEVLIATKCGLVWHTARATTSSTRTAAGAPLSRRRHRSHEIDESLRRLRTDYIDLYITHWQDPTTPVAETMVTLIDP